MKRILLAVVVLILPGIIYPGPPLLAQPSKTPHENPARATGLFDRAALLLSYSQIARQATGRQYQNARETLKELGLVAAPENIRYIISQYNILNDKLFTALDKLENLLGETTDMLARNRVDEARQNIDSSEALIQESALLLEDTRAATRSLSEKLGVLTVPVTDRLSQAYTRLEESMTRLAELIEGFKNIREDLKKRYTELTWLTRTSISLSFGEERVFVGDNIVATGALMGGDTPLAGKTVSLIAGNVTAATAVTGYNGAYAASIIVPYIYSDKATISAVYQPAGDDAKLYLASRSESFKINSYLTRFKVTAPPRVYRGVPFTLSGEVGDGDSNISRCLKVCLDDHTLAEAIVTGQFSFQVTPPRDEMQGQRNLTVIVTPVGRYSGTSEKLDINLATMLLHIQAQTPAIVCLPGVIHVRGTVSSELGPLADVPVHITSRQSITTARTAPDGSFSGTIRSPELFPITSNRLEIQSGIPGVVTVTRTLKRQVLIINPSSTGLTLVLVAALAAVLYRKRQTRKNLATAPTTAASINTPALVNVTSVLSQPVLKPSGIKGRIISVYINCLTVLEKITGITMAPSATLREFLKTARLPSPSAAEGFAELTAIAERALYAASDPPDIIAIRAEELGAIISKEFGRGNP